jgi:hypothetical protein
VYVHRGACIVRCPPHAGTPAPRRPAPRRRSRLDMCLNIYDRSSCAHPASPIIALATLMEVLFGCALCSDHACTPFRSAAPRSGMRQSVCSLRAVMAARFNRTLRGKKFVALHASQAHPASSAPARHPGRRWAVKYRDARALMKPLAKRRPWIIHHSPVPRRATCLGSSANAPASSRAAARTPARHAQHIQPQRRRSCAPLTCQTRAPWP